MIPDYPALKAKLFEHWTDYAVARHRQNMGFLGSLPHRRDYEGSRRRLERADGSVSESEYLEIQSRLRLDPNEALNLTPEKVVQKLDDLAKDMAAQTERGLFKHLNETLAEAGRVINAGNRPFDQNMFFELLDSVEIDFDERGEPIMPTMVMSPKMWESIKEEVQHWDADPAFRVRHDRIMTKKRESWRARESRRKLVE